MMSIARHVKCNVLPCYFFLLLGSVVTFIGRSNEKTTDNAANCYKQDKTAITQALPKARRNPSEINFLLSSFGSDQRTTQSKLVDP